MKFTINENEYTIKARQAIEILNLVEKAGLFDDFKNVKSVETDMTKVSSDLTSMIPKMYVLALDILAIATGSWENGQIKRNDAVADDLPAMELPMYAINIVKGLVFPIQYSMSDDKGIADEKKKDSGESVDTSPGNPESKGEPTAS